MKPFVTFVVILAAIGCGDPGSSGGDAGLSMGPTANRRCAAPTGCDAVIFDGVCSYACTSGQSVCVGTGDGGVTSAPPVVDSMPSLYTANLSNDPRNCGACGNRCPAGAPYCVRSGCSTTP